MVDEDNIHDILTRIHDGQIIGRGEGKTTALLYLALDLATSNESLTIDYIHQGQPDNHVKLLMKLSTEEFIIEPKVVMGTQKTAFNIGKSTIHLQTKGFSNRRGYNSYLSIYDLSNDNGIGDVIKIESGGYRNNILEANWVNPIFPPDFQNIVGVANSIPNDVKSLQKSWSSINV